MALAKARDGADSAILSEDALLASRRAFLPDDYQGDDIWVFGYGSLIWKPIVEFCESQLAHIHGYHRRFCMWTTIGRGAPDCPGLVLALDQGGSTKGMIFRIPAEKAAQELDILWRREMMANSYRPVWVKAKTKNRLVPALSFAIRRDSPIFAPPLPDEATAKIIYNASGFVGPCKEYLRETQKALQIAGIKDRQMTKLCRLVDELEKDEI